MSLRVALFKLWHNGRLLLRSQQYGSFATGWKRTNNINILKESTTRGATGGGRGSDSYSTTPRYRPSFVQGQYDSARKLFVDNILRRVTNSLSNDMRKKATKSLLFGNSTPFFAFVGVSLASGTGIITKQDELDALCWEIREAVAKMQESLMKAESDLFESDGAVSLNDFSIGPLIGIGANAVVHAVKKIPQTDEGGSSDAHGSDPVVDVALDSSNVLNRKSGSDATNLKSLNLSLDQDLKYFPCAMKTMFNYYIESNAPRIIRAMFREIIPARVKLNQSEEFDAWQTRLMEDCVELPCHPNIVTMHCVFVDWVRDLPGTQSHCPMALPPSLYSQGVSRNKTLYILMKRYDASLKTYLEERRVSVRQGILLLTQLLEGVTHINSHGIAHRDLKTDNILLETDVERDQCPTLVISDFGCCLSTSDGSLTTPYRTHDMDIGGNIALMAPEILKVEAGLFSTLDYSKSDCWSCGTLAYEIFTGRNPFYPGRHLHDAPKLNSIKYKVEDLPQLDQHSVPLVVAKLIRAILDPNPKKRPSAEFAATILHVYLWGPSSWQKPPMPSSSEILQWLLCLTTKVLCGGSIGSQRSNAEFLLISSFLRRSRISTVRQALSFIQLSST